MPKQILLVEDSATITKAVQIAFAREDFAITVCKSADDAIAKAKSAKPDLVLADSSMAGKTGYDVCAALRADAGLSGVVCLILSGSASPYDEAKAQAAGADGNIVKPFETQGLVDKINEALKKGRAGSSVSAAASAPVAAPAPVPVPAAAPAAHRATLMGIPAAAPAPAPAPAAAKPAQAWSPPPAAAAPAPAPVAAKPAAAPAPATSAAPTSPASATIPSSAPQMPRAPMIPNTIAPIHVAALQSLSKELVEKIVWEVVPELAETIIREQLDRLVKERQQSA